MGAFRQRYRERFYRGFLAYNALEDDLLFYVVCDTLFLTQVKGLSMEQVSLLIFLSIALSLLAQYPLLKWANKAGNKIAVRAGAAAFAVSALLITFSSAFPLLLLGGFVKCVGHTLNSLGTAVLKNHLVREGKGDFYVVYASDANSAASLLTLVTSLSCGALYAISPYVPMAACIAFSFVGVGSAFWITRGEGALGATSSTSAAGLAGTEGSADATPAAGAAGVAEGNLAAKHPASARASSRNLSGFLLMASFALFTALSGIGQSYERLNFQAVLADMDPAQVAMILSVIASAIHVARIVANTVLGAIYAKVGDVLVAIASGLLVAGVLLQFLPWVTGPASAVVLLCAGYLVVCFLYDPYCTLIQNGYLKRGGTKEHQSALIMLNAAKKVGALALSAVATVLMDAGGEFAVMGLLLCCAILCMAMTCALFARQRPKSR